VKTKSLPLESWKYDVIGLSEFRLRQSMRIHLKNIPAKLYPDPIWNEGALGFWRRSPQVEKQEEQDE